MKTEMVMGEKRLLRLKIEVMVLEAIREQLKEDRRTHFVELIDKGKTDTYKVRNGRDHQKCTTLDSRT